MSTFLPDGFRGFSVAKDGRKAVGTVGAEEDLHTAFTFGIRHENGELIAYNSAAHRECTQCEIDEDAKKKPEEPKTCGPVADYKLVYGYQYPGWWELSYAYLNKSAPLRVSTIESEVGDSRIWFEHGFYMGLRPKDDEGPTATNSRINVNVIDEADPGTRVGAPGDILFNKHPVTHVGWVCVADSNGQTTWKKFGKIE